MVVNQKSFVVGTAINYLIIILSLIFNCPILYAITLLIWVNMVIFALSDIGRRSMLFAFLVAFFVFLMGRAFVQYFFSYGVEYFDSDVENHASICLIISLMTIFVFYYLFDKKNKKTQLYNSGKKYHTDEVVMMVSRIAFYLTWVFAVVSKIAVVRYVGSNTYFSYYTDYSEYLTNNIPLYILSKIELITPVCFSIFMASMPTKKQFKIPCCFYVGYILLSLGTGQRSTFVLGSLWLAVYFLFRNKIDPDEEWVRKSYVVAVVVAVPFLLIFLSVYSSWREGKSIADINVFSSILDFFYSQGVSLNVVKRAYMYKERIPDQIYTLEFLHSGVFAKLFGIEVYHGNTVAHAMQGGSFTHSMGYVVLGQQYLSGRGTGSSYIAELYQDFGYVGIFLGNVLYSWIIANINKVGEKRTVFWMSVRFYIVSQILWAPRGSFTGFLSYLFAPSTLACLIGIFVISNMIKSSQAKKKRQYDNLPKTTIEVNGDGN